MTATNASKVAPATSARHLRPAPDRNRVGSAATVRSRYLPGPCFVPHRCCRDYSAADSVGKAECFAEAQRNISLRRLPYIIAVVSWAESDGFCHLTRRQPGWFWRISLRSRFSTPLHNSKRLRVSRSIIHSQKLTIPLLSPPISVTGRSQVPGFVRPPACPDAPALILAAWCSSGAAGTGRPRSRCAGRPGRSSTPRPCRFSPPRLHSSCAASLSAARRFRARCPCAGDRALSPRCRCRARPLDAAFG